MRGCRCLMLPAGVGERIFPQQVRTLAQPSKWKQKQKKRAKQPKRIPRPPKRHKKFTVDDRSAPADSVADHHVPPALLLPTASPYAYVAKMAVITAENGINPRHLFSDVADPSSQRPRRGSFHYFAPVSFGHELPTHDTPEVAFLGRSNVGKSSLINALMRRKLAVTSKQPGRTQQVHYYGYVENNSGEQPPKVSDVAGFLVDLPGYGYAAKAPDQALDAWQATTQDFLLQRRDTGQLRRLFLLQDARVGPTWMDLTVASWLEEADIFYSVVWTKTDAVRIPETIKWVNQSCMRYHELLSNPEEQNDDDSSSATPQEDDDNSEDKGEIVSCCQSPVIHVTSSKDRLGLEELWSAVQAEFAVQS